MKQENLAAPKFPSARSLKHSNCERTAVVMDIWMFRLPPKLGRNEYRVRHDIGRP